MPNLLFFWHERHFLFCLSICQYITILRLLLILQWSILVNNFADVLLLMTSLAVFLMKNVFLIFCEPYWKRQIVSFIINKNIKIIVKTTQILFVQLNIPLLFSLTQIPKYGGFPILQSRE